MIRKMKSQLKALHMSLALHVFIIALFVIMNNTLPHGNNLLVIDFTMEDAASSALFLNKPAGTTHPPEHKQQKVKREEAENPQQKDIVKSNFVTLPPARQEKQERATPDALAPFSAQNDKVSASEKNDKIYDANQNALSMNDNKAVLSKETTARQSGFNRNRRKS